MAIVYTTKSKIFIKEEQKYRVEERHFLFLRWEVKVPVDKPKKELIVFVKENDDIDTVKIFYKNQDPGVVKL